MSPKESQQRRLVFMDEKLWTHLPKRRRERCRRLLGRLLREVVFEEARQRRGGHE